MQKLPYPWHCKRKIPFASFSYSFPLQPSVFGEIGEDLPFLGENRSGVRHVFTLQNFYITCVLRHRSTCSFWLARWVGAYYTSPKWIPGYIVWFPKKLYGSEVDILLNNFSESNVSRRLYGTRHCETRFGKESFRYKLWKREFYCIFLKKIFIIFFITDSRGKKSPCFARYNWILI